MGFFSAMKKAFTNNKIILDGWNVLTEAAQLQDVLTASKQQPQLVYKHSFTCGICHMAKDEIEEHFNALFSQADMHFVDVKQSRAVSNAVAEHTGVRHESPQVLIIDQGECVWHKSHWSIKANAILEVLR